MNSFNSSQVSGGQYLFENNHKKTINHHSKQYGKGM